MDQKRLVLWIVCVFSACAPSFLTPPAEKDLSLLTAGTRRAQVHKELGHPAATYTDRETGTLHDVFRFRQGYPKAVRRALTVAAVGSFLAGFAVVPQGTSMAINVTYDAHHRVVRFHPVPTPN